MDDILSISADLIKDIYKQAYQTPTNEFKEKVFQSLKSFLDIDAGTWITRGNTDAHFYESDSYACALPDGFFQEPMHSEEVSEQIQKIFAVVSESPGRTFDILDVLPEGEWFGSALYQLYCKKYQLNHSLMTLQLEPHNQVINLVTYARHDIDRCFTYQDKQRSEWIQPCLVEGLKINLLNQFQHKNQDAFYGVFDTFGNLIEAEDALITLFQQTGLFNDGYSMLIQDNPNRVFEHQGLMIETNSHHGLVLVEVMKSALVNALSSRQLDICHHLVSGKTNKEIAKSLKLSPDTINNHLKRIFSTLNVSTRYQAVGYLMRQEILR
ncbi:MAG: helix-turn-helix transcriptional regulator [Paraglaciecola sp.]|uniref:response regulator transcription factor n=1 Tax=Paraglaciecola sp. TaxID=1920173 RepID=UPI0032983B49